MEKSYALNTLSPQVLEVLADQAEFFAPVSELLTETGLNLWGTDPQARVERVETPDGSVSVRFIFPIDDNENGADGRLWLRDEFRFDPQGRLQDFQHRFQLDAPGSEPRWAELFQKFQDSPTRPRQAAVARFAELLARRFLGPEEWRPLPAEGLQALRDHVPFLLKSLGTAPELMETMELRVTDAQSHYRVEVFAEEIRLWINWVWDDDGEPLPNRLFLQQKWTLDRDTQELKRFAQHWERSPALEDEATPDPELALLNGQAIPTEAEAAEFLGGMRRFFRLPPRHPDAWLLPLSQRQGLPAETLAAMERRGAATRARRQGRAARQAEALQILETMAWEDLAKDLERQAGWLHRGATLQATSEAAALRGLFAKARETAALGRDAHAFAVLAGLELSDSEARWRARLLDGRIFQRVNDAAQEPYDAVRLQHFALLAEELLAAEYFQASRKLAESRAGHAGAPRRLRELQQWFAGHAPAKLRLHYELPLLLDQWSEPGPLLAMGAAGLLGPVAETLGLRCLGRFGWLGRGAAGAMAVGTEALAFTAVERAAAAAHRDPQKVFANFRQDLAGAGLLFGGLRLARVVAAGLVGNKAPAWIQAVTRHGAGLAAFWGADWLGRRLAWKPAGSAEESEHMLQSAVGYLQAWIGGVYAYRLTSGFFPQAVAKLRAGLAKPKAPGPAPVEAPPVAEPSPGEREARRQIDVVQEELRRAKVLIEIGELETRSLQRQLQKSEAELAAEQKARMALRRGAEELQRQLKELQGQSSEDATVKELQAQDWSNEYEKGVLGKAGLREPPEAVPTRWEKKR